MKRLWLHIATVNLLACLCYCVAIASNHFLTRFCCCSFHCCCCSWKNHSSEHMNLCLFFLIAGFVCLRLARMVFCLVTFTIRSSTYTLPREHTHTHTPTHAIWPIFAWNIYRIVHINDLNMYKICKCVRWFVRWLHDLFFFWRFFHFVFSDSHFLSIPSLLAIHVR